MTVKPGQGALIEQRANTAENPIIDHMGGWFTCRTRATSSFQTLCFPKLHLI